MGYLSCTDQKPPVNYWPECGMCVLEGTQIAWRSTRPGWNVYWRPKWCSAWSHRTMSRTATCQVILPQRVQENIYLNDWLNDNGQNPESNIESLSLFERPDGNRSLVLRRWTVIGHFSISCGEPRFCQSLRSLSRIFGWPWKCFEWCCIH